MDLRTDHPFWLLHDRPPACYPPLTADATCEVLVLGAGITGAIAAYLLAEAGMDTIVIDKRDVAAGSTVASTGLLQYATDTELSDLIERIGERDAVRCYQLGLEAIDTLGDLACRLGDDQGCAFERATSIYMAGRKAHLPRLRREYDCRLRCGFDVQWLDAGDLESRFGLRAEGAILCGGDGQIDPHRLTHGLLGQAAARGARIHDRTEATRFEHTQRRVTVRTAEGHNIRASRIVFATGYESQQYLRRNVGTVHTTFAMASEPLKSSQGSLPPRHLLWETSRPYFYMRSTSDGRIMAGGADGPFRTGAALGRMVPGRTNVILKRYRQLFPESQVRVACAWGGVFGQTKDGLAYIGETRERPRASFALGYGGNGITFGVIAGQMIRDHMLGRRNRDARIFRFDR